MADVVADLYHAEVGFTSRVHQLTHKLDMWNVPILVMADVVADLYHAEVGFSSRVSPADSHIGRVDMC